MERKSMNGQFSPSTSVDSGAISTSLPPPPDYTSPAVQDALEHLASIDLIDLCKEAKVERCRATRDLRSCSRDVKDVLNSCGHSSLCAECCQRCDVCPICRNPIPNNNDRVRLRLYYECVQAGLISRGFEERFHGKEDGDNQAIADVERLYSIFDVALQNGLVSLICHYVTDVCMDESAISSDPVIAFLLDEVVVKDWCKSTFKNIVKELQRIYNLEIEEMNSMLSTLLNLSVYLAGISNIVEVLGASFKNSLSAKLDDLQDLQENTVKTKQHTRLMIWCIRHQFLENIESRYTDFALWKAHVRERKSAAIKRSWYDAVNHIEESGGEGGSLFIEDAIVNLEMEQEHMHYMAEELAVASLLKGTASLFFRSKIEGAGCYPFENLRAAVDILFLQGSSDLVVAKQAIFLYYLYDRHYTMPKERWRDIIDDFAANFGVSRHSLLECFIFYLLDDHTDKALQEACAILPEICDLNTHPKIAEVLLERQMPETALMVLRWSGRDGGSQLVTLKEAITSLRVRVECGLLTEAFMHQRMLCAKVWETKEKNIPSMDASNELNDDTRSWLDWINMLVTEICCLCIRRNLVDRIIEMPWNLNEEKYLRNCLLNHAADDPSTTTGSLLVVFYLQRYRYAEACQVDLKLQCKEHELISRSCTSEEVLSRMKRVSQWRTGLVEKCMKLLPEVQQQQQLQTGKSPEVDYGYGKDEQVLVTSHLSEPAELKSSSLLFPSSARPLSKDHTTSLKQSSFDSTKKQYLPISKPLELHSLGFPLIHNGSDDFKTPLSEIKKTSSRVRPNTKFRGVQFDRLSPEIKESGFQRIDTPYPHRVVPNLATPLNNNHSLFEDSLLNNVHGLENMTPAGEGMDISSYGEKVSNMNANGGPRWRLDETSDEEEEAQNMDREMGVASRATPASRSRRRFAQ